LFLLQNGQVASAIHRGQTLSRTDAIKLWQQHRWLPVSDTQPWPVSSAAPDQGSINADW